MSDDTATVADQRMNKSLDALRKSLSRLRTGRARPELLDGISVNCYGNETPLNQVAKVDIGDARTLLITVWDKSIISAVDKALRDSDLGLNPVSGSDNIRVPLPPLSEERRRDLAKVARQETEQARVSVRNIRRDLMRDLKQQLADKEISDDENRRISDKLQKATDNHINSIDKMLTDKESELLTLG